MGSGGNAAACPAAAGGADAGADEAVRGAQVRVARLLPPSVAESSYREVVGPCRFSSADAWKEGGWAVSTVSQRKFLGKRPASGPASKLASPVSSAQVGPA